MRLLDVYTYPPPQPEDKLTKRQYAILSHTWAETEIVFSDLSTRDSVFQARMRRDLNSWRKISGAQQKAKEDGFDFIWIDTVCIVKSSSTELSEAINSMYRWYQEAEVCYVYLSDVDYSATPVSESMQEMPFSSVDGLRSEQLERSKWFKRGWTLQELLAPKALYFFDAEWNLIGSREELLETISEITRIDTRALKNAPLQGYSIAQRMSWAAGRHTTRPEDRAYSLLGVLDVSLDIRYGEGDKAFMRLQEEIIARSADQSLFAWGEPLTPQDKYEMQSKFPRVFKDGDLLAPSPDAFASASNIVPFFPLRADSTYTVTNRGLRIVAPVVDNIGIFLNCRYLDDPTIAILLNAYDPERKDHDIDVGLSHASDGARVRLKIPRHPFNGRKWSRLSLLTMAEIAPFPEPSQLTIEKSLNVLASSRSLPGLLVEPLYTERFWLVLTSGLTLSKGTGWLRRAEHWMPDMGLLRHFDWEPFEFVDSEPNPQRSTCSTTLTYSIDTAQTRSNHVFTIRLEHPRGCVMDLLVRLVFSQKEGDGCQMQMSVLDHCADRSLTQFRESIDLSTLEVDFQASPSEHIRDNVSTTCVYILDQKHTAVALLRRENLSGEFPFVLRVSMVATTPRIVWSYSFSRPIMRQIYSLVERHADMIVLSLLVSLGIFLIYLVVSRLGGFYGAIFAAALVLYVEFITNGPQNLPPELPLGHTWHVDDFIVRSLIWMRRRFADHLTL